MDYHDLHRRIVERKFNDNVTLITKARGSGQELRFNIPGSAQLRIEDAKSRGGLIIAGGGKELVVGYAKANGERWDARVPINDIIDLELLKRN